MINPYLSSQTADKMKTDRRTAVMRIALFTCTTAVDGFCVYSNPIALTLR